MEYRPLGRSDIRVSAICLGSMNWGSRNSEAEGFAQMDMAFDRGVNFVDSAEMYAVPPSPATFGRSEEILGAWMKARGNRSRVVVATKVAGPDARPQQGESVPAQGEQAPRMVQAHHGDQPRGADIVSGADEAAIAPRRAPADPLRLQQHDALDAALGEAQGGGQPRQPAADDADPRLEVALQGLAGGVRRPRPGVVAVDIAVDGGGRGVHGQG